MFPITFIGRRRLDELESDARGLVTTKASLELAAAELEEERAESMRLGEALDRRTKQLAEADFNLDSARLATDAAERCYRERSKALSAANRRIADLEREAADERRRTDRAELDRDAAREEAFDARAERDKARDLVKTADATANRRAEKIRALEDAGRHALEAIGDLQEQLRELAEARRADLDELNGKLAEALDARDKARALLVETLEARYVAEARADRSEARARDLVAELERARPARAFDIDAPDPYDPAPIPAY